MEIDPLQPEPDKLIQKSEKLKTLTNGSISTSISKLSGSSRVLPSEKDFHFYYNFDEFRASIDEIGAKSQSMLKQISSAKPLWGGKEMDFPQDVDDEAYDWLVNVNDEVIERFDVSVDEFSRSRKAEEESAKARRIERKMVDDNGFQLVTGKKKKGVGVGGSEGSEKEENVETTSNVRVVERDKKTEGPKSKIPFHIPTIRKPQEVYNILVNNSNTPFQHVWLERSEDGLRFVHPLEKLSLDDFLDCNIENLEPVKPPPLESTPFKFVEDVKELKELAAKLRAVNEFSVDLEHNQYRSFQGLTCLMQISTRTEDFVVDTFKLRIHIGPYLREIFKDPTKRKVMHGADRDIVWLQRDFGIYVCNLFDTGQASRVLQMERFSLEHLLQHFCGVTANKQYQNADWRLRPLPREMLRYAREDTHYLLYIYDLMRIRLLSESKDPENPKALLQEVYKRSYDVCMQLYEKELLTDTSYLYIYGVQTADLNAQQLSVISGLCEWRDAIARAEDESTGFILPNKVLLEIAKQMPLTTGKLRHTIKSKLPFVERNLGAIVSIIRHSVQNSSSFEAVAQQLKEGRIQMAHELDTVGSDIIEAQNDGDDNGEGSEASRNEHPPIDVQVKVDSFKPTGQNGSMAKDANGSSISEIKRGPLAFSSHKNVTGATVQLLKKPGRGFGALLGSSASKKKIDLKKEEEKLEEIKSSVSASFYSSFSYNRGPDFKELPKQAPEEPKRTTNMEESPCERDLSSITEDVISLNSHRHSKQSPQDRNKVPESKASGSNTKLDDVILLDSESSDDDDDDEPEDNSAQNQTNVNSNDDQIASKPELVVLDDDDDEDEDNEPISLSDLSSSFQKCLQTANQNQEKESKETGSSKFQPFDYESARKEVKFGEEKKSKNVDKDDKNGGKKKSGVDRSNKDEGVLAQGKRRQAFPASGNRSATFR